jgi:tubulin epsilon
MMNKSLLAIADHEQISEAIRREVEFCDALSSFFLISSLGGGTGSGLGSYVGELLADEYPDVFKFANVIFPSPNDDVVTSPYNSYDLFLIFHRILSLSKINDYADCVLPVENKALLDIYQRILSQCSTHRPGASTATTIADNGDRVFTDKNAAQPKAFDTMVQNS